MQVLMGLILCVSPDLIPANRNSYKTDRDSSESNDFIETDVSEVAEKPQDRHP